jgi:threonine/homoserine/homoserine lactone efflux protein
MISLQLFIALASFYFVMFVTPGPNNAMLTASGIKFGFKRTLPHLIGIPCGHIVQITLVCLGLGKIFQIYPYIQEVLKYVCAAYLLYLGYKIIGSFSEHKKNSSRPLKLYEAALFQFVNPKAWTVAIMVASGFFPKEEILIIAILFSTLTAAIVCFPSICLWALFGSSIRLMIKNTKIKKIVEFLLAFLLLLTAIIIIIN